MPINYQSVPLGTSAFDYLKRVLIQTEEAGNIAHRATLRTASRGH